MLWNYSTESCTLLSLPTDMKIPTPQDDPVRLASAQLEELDYGKLYHTHSSQGRKSAAEPKLEEACPET